jgi:septal ring factor EnvC (AmiA/AmiB activator)
MAKAAKKRIVKPATKVGKPGRRPATAKTVKTVKSAASAKKPAKTKAVVVSKDELRAQLEKAQNLIAAFRAKSREAVRAAKASATQIADLEAKVAQLERKLAAPEKSTKPVSAAVKPAKQRGRKVAVQADGDASIESADPVLAAPETLED